VQVNQVGYLPDGPKRATVVTSAASNPLVKVAAFSYGVRKAAANRRHADEEREVRATLKEQRKARRGRRTGGDA